MVSDAAARRVLIHIPIIHTQADMGALGERIKGQLVRRFGAHWWRSKVDAVDRFWDDVEAALLGGELPFERVRIYQDGLPVCGRELDIVKELAAAGSRNHRLVLEMLRRGATVMGTESGEFLIEEYGRIRRLLGSTAALPGSEDVRASGAALLNKRDRFIAERIDATLTPGEVGILFLGMLHSIGRFLPKDVRLVGFAPFEDNHSRLKQAVSFAQSLG